jgi:hypothetical protein
MTGFTKAWETRPFLLVAWGFEIAAERSVKQLECCAVFEEAVQWDAII